MAERIIGPTEKICKDCLKSKPIDHFRLDKNGKGVAYRRPRCKPCAAAKDADKYKRRIAREGRSVLTERVRKWKADNPESNKAIQDRTNMRRRKSESDKHMAKLKARVLRDHKLAISMHQKHLEAGRMDKRAAWRDWLRNAPDGFLDRHYAKKPWNDHRLTRSQQSRLKRKLCSEFAIYDRMRSAARKQAKDGNVAEAMRRAIKNSSGSNKVEILCGYSIMELKEHLESLFVEGMSWQAFNEGRIHIDHIIPKSVFNCEDDQELLDCWCLDNLQPLWAKDNLAKKEKAVAHLCDPVLWMKYGGRLPESRIADKAAWKNP